MQSDTCPTNGLRSRVRTSPYIGASSPAAHGLTLVAVVAAAAVVLILTASSQIFDSNFYAMTGAVSLLSGDRIYRDFFEPGVPLGALTAAAAQALSGYRLIGEFARQWLFILTGFAIAAHLGVRLSQSRRATLAMMATALPILAVTPIYHHDKLFFFPLIVWLGWRYVDWPTPGRAVTCGCATAIGFLFRHDYGAYLGAASVGAFLLGRVTVPARRQPRVVVRDAAAYAGALLMVLAPWLVAVDRSEGLLEYARSRAQLFQGQPGVAYASLLHLNPIRTFTPPSLPSPKSAAVVVSWDDTVDEGLQRQLEREYALRFLTRDGRGRWHYELPNVYDMRLLNLEPYVNDTDGFQWDLLHDVRRKLPVRENVIVWVQQMALLMPIALCAVAAYQWLNRNDPRSEPSDARRLLLAGGVLFVVDVALLRQASYVVVAPITSALSARFLASRVVAIRACVIVLAVLTIIATLVWMSGGPLHEPPSELIRTVRGTLTQLVASPPDRGNLSLRYLRDCTAPGDHVLVTGETPLDVSYYAHRPIAGGQINWHYGWRSDAAHEAESLALLQRQSVPIAFSTEDPVLDNFKSYPRIRAYLERYYLPVEGTDGLIMVDARRRPTGSFGPGGFPCFR
jgi:hypothetical protein